MTATNLKDLTIFTLKQRLAEINKMIEIGADPEYFKDEKNRIIGMLDSCGCDNWFDINLPYEEANHFAKF